MQVALSVSPPASNQHDSTCPFCAGGQCDLKGYNTKHGQLKDEKQLEKNLASTSQITSDPKVGNLYPLSGGSEPHAGWIVKQGVFEDIPVEIKAAAHHLVPGNAAMAPSSLEKWTCASKGKIKEDIGYSIDCAQNGIWLPHLPHIHWTRYWDKIKKIKFSEIYGTWKSRTASQRNAIGFIVMGDTWLQMHYTDHSARYVNVDNQTTYDGEAEERCNLLAEVVDDFWSVECPEAKDSTDDKYYPPYGLVQRINLQSQYMRERITGRPAYWESWVSPLAQDYTQALRTRQVKQVMHFYVSRKPV